MSALLHSDCCVLLQECYRPVDGFLAGHDLVLQAEEHNSNALINAVMASTARHPFWLRVLELMQERAASAHNVLYATGAKGSPHTQKLIFSCDAEVWWLRLQGHGLCGHGHQVRLAIADLAAELTFLYSGLYLGAGPQVVSEAYKTYEKASDGTSEVRVSLRGRGMQKKLTPHVYQLGEFYLPCNWLSQDLCAQVDSAKTKPADLAGFHHWAGSWKVVRVV